MTLRARLGEEIRVRGKETWAGGLVKQLEKKRIRRHCMGKYKTRGAYLAIPSDTVEPLETFEGGGYCLRISARLSSSSLLYENTTRP